MGQNTPLVLSLICRCLNDALGAGNDTILWCLFSSQLWFVNVVDVKKCLASVAEV